jgi:hypothetical protein
VPKLKVAALCYDKSYRKILKKTKGNLINATFGAVVIVPFDFVLLYCCKNKCVSMCATFF